MHDTTSSTEPSPEHPPVDSNNKLQADALPRSRTTTMNSVMRTFSSSRALHHVLGMREPEPFVTPPEMPHDLKERFEAGLHEQSCSASLFTPGENNRLAAVVSPPDNRLTLAGILEEEESRVRATPTQSAQIAVKSGLKIDVPKWTSAKQAVAVAPRYTFLDSDSEASADYRDEDIGSVHEDEDHSLWTYGSNTTLAISEQSRPGSATSSGMPSTIPPPSFPPRTSSLCHLCEDNGTNAQPPQHLLADTPPTGLRLHRTRTGVSVHNDSTRQIQNFDYNNTTQLRRMESLPVSFPSSGVKPQSWGFVQTDSGFSLAGLDDSAPDNECDVETSSIPHITIQAPSPKKAPISKKRSPPSSARDFESPLAQRTQRSDSTGLTVLPADAEALWKSKFPGNTHALLTILLTWSHAMWSFYHQLPNPRLFAVHSAFPYPVTPPLKRRLLSVSFYDTSVKPHREIRFLGPGDAAEMSYHEVDVFSDANSNPNSHATAQPTFPISVLKQTFGLNDTEPARPTHSTSPAQHAKTGQGRWCYILLQGALPRDSHPPLHLILAWPSSGVTATSNCLHTLSPSTASKPHPTPLPQRPLTRFSSLQNLATTLRNPPRPRTLRSATSTSALPPVGADAHIQQRNATLHRTVLRMERPGCIPLVEGYRVDVAAFRGWLDACGKGRGKVVMWRERDGGWD